MMRFIFFLLVSLLACVPTFAGEYLGNLSSNPYDSDSIKNPYGAGSPYNPNSITNPYGKYGSPFSPNSVTNPYSTNAPRLYDGQGHYRGRLSTNPYDPDSVSNPCGRYGNPYSTDSINNPFGAGNPIPPTMAKASFRWLALIGSKTRDLRQTGVKKIRTKIISCKGVKSHG
jgi:hypothetical protein